MVLCLQRLLTFGEINGTNSSEVVLSEIHQQCSSVFDVISHLQFSVLFSLKYLFISLYLFTLFETIVILVIT